MESQLGLKIRVLREKQPLYLRQVAEHLNMDVAQLSKIEKGVRVLRKEQIPVLSDIFQISRTELDMLWLEDQISNIVKNEPLAEMAIKNIYNRITQSK